MFLCLIFSCVCLFCFSIIPTSFLVNKGEYNSLLFYTGPLRGGKGGKLPRAPQCRRGPADLSGVRQPVGGPVSDHSSPGPKTGSQRA